MTDILAAYKTFDRSTARSTVHATLHLITNSPTAGWDSDSRRTLADLLLTDIAHVTSTSRLSHQDVEAALSAVKALGRQEDVSSVVIHPATQYSVDVVNQALRCIANALLLNDAGSKAWLDLGGGQLALEELKKPLSSERLFLLARILFLVTLKPTPFISLLIEKGLIRGLAVALPASYRNLRAQYSFGKESLIDLLKVTFNLMTHYPRMKGNESQKPADGSEHVLGDFWDDQFTILVPTLLEIFDTLPPTSPPLQPPMTHLLHVLIHLPATLLCESSASTPQCSSMPPGDAPFVPKADGVDILERLYKLLERTLHFYVEYDPDDLKVRRKCRENGVVLDELVVPLPIILTRLVKENNEARARVRQWVLPRDLDRSHPLEKRRDVLGLFIRMMTSIHHPHLKETTSELLFCLCNQDAAELSAQIGYGNAAGFLYSKGIMSAPTTEYDSHGNLLNPITGTNAPIRDNSGVDMTDEEKEQEAERLFVLFDRLEKSGLGANPIRKAQQEGRLQD
ncbi:guanine nucleotide exchange factor [Cantharellus anzutake]|uniref:guanine nucleotide exchange factor n=1 Tax=Cantharellus anzutake TaxID=1750568 RepID=UPI00190535E1|nr:guanine nucleotide exchange factor [Cantharellus anzutake]KAF8334996.1 guanine nucleotide exchange factor [Cantharellus anzutake]